MLIYIYDSISYVLFQHSVTFCTGSLSSAAIRFSIAASCFLRCEAFILFKHCPAAFEYAKKIDDNLQGTS